MPARPNTSLPDTSYDERVKKLWATGMAPKVIRERLGLSEGKLTSIRKRLNLPPAKRTVDWR